MRQILACATFLLTAAVLHAQSREQAIRDLIRTFADARNAGNGAAVAALYSEDGEWLAATYNGRAKGREALTKLWTNLRGKVQRDIESIETPAGHLAIVRVATLYDDPKIGLHHEVFILVNEGGKWKIRVHETAD